MILEQHTKINDLRKLCNEVHQDGGWSDIPWSPNRRAVHLEAVDGNHALFSTFAPYWECQGRVAGTFKVPVTECTFERLNEETEMAIGFAVADLEKLTGLTEARPTTFDMHMTPSRPNEPDASGVATLEMLGGEGGASDGGRHGFNSGYHDLPSGNYPPGFGVREYTNPDAAPIDNAVKKQEMADTDSVGTVVPPKRENTIDPNDAAKFAKLEKRVHEEKVLICPHCHDEIREKWLGEDESGGHRHRGPCWDKGPFQIPEGYFTPVPENWKGLGEARSAVDPTVELTAEEEAAFREWFEAEVFVAENGDQFVDQAFRGKDEMLRSTGWQQESVEPWLEAWKATLAEEVDPNNPTPPEMGTKKYQAAVAVVVKEGRYVLLGKAKSNDDRDGKWCFPGGGIDPEDGNDPVRAAIREVYEEAGVAVTSKGVVLSHPDKPGVAFVVCEYAERPDRAPEPNKEFHEFMWLDHDVRFDCDLDIYPPNKSILERIPKDALYHTKEVAEAVDTILGEEVALKRQKPNKRAWAVSSNSRRITTGVNSDPNRRSKAGSSDRTKDRPSDKSVSATQSIKGKKALSSPAAPQDSAEKLHFSPGAKNPRRAATDKKKEMDRVKQGRDPSALKPGDAGTPGAADAEKEAKNVNSGDGKGAGGGGAPGGAQKPAGGPSVPSPAQAATMPVNDLVQAAQAVLAAAGVQGAAPAPGGAPPAQKPADGKKPAPGAGQPTAGDSPASKDKKDKATKAQSPGASTPTEPQQQPQQPGQATPPGQMPQQQQPQGPQQGTQPGAGQGVGGQAQQPPQPGQPGQQQGMQPGQPGQQPPQQPGMQQGPQGPQPIQPTQGMPPGQPGVPNDMTAPGMMPQQPQGMPAFQARVVDLILKDRGNAEKCFRWLQALGFQPSTPDHTTVQVICNTHEEMFLTQRTAKVFGLEMAGLTPQ